MTVFISHSFSCFNDLNLGKNIPWEKEWCYSIWLFIRFQKKLLLLTFNKENKIFHSWIPSQKSESFIWTTLKQQDSITAAHAPYPSASKEKSKPRVPANHMHWKCIRMRFPHPIWRGKAFAKCWEGEAVVVVQLRQNHKKTSWSEEKLTITLPAPTFHASSTLSSCRSALRGKGANVS